MQSRFWRQIRSRTTPLLTRPWTKDACFFSSFEAYNMAGFVRRRKKLAAMRFEQVHGFISVKKKILWGQWHFNNNVNSPSQDFTYHHEWDSTRVSQQNLNVFCWYQGQQEGFVTIKALFTFKNRLFLDKFTHKKRSHIFTHAFYSFDMKFFVVNINAVQTE